MRRPGVYKWRDGQGPLRYKGFMQGMEEAGLRAKDRNVVWIDSEDMVEMEYWSDYLFRRIGDCTAVVCYNDEVAYILSGICEKRGISIPDQLSLVGHVISKKTRWLAKPSKPTSCGVKCWITRRSKPSKWASQIQVVDGMQVAVDLGDVVKLKQDVFGNEPDLLSSGEYARIVTE